MQDDGPLLGRIVRSADFVWVLAKPPQACSAHFAVHYAQGTKRADQLHPSVALMGELSTGRHRVGRRGVDDLVFSVNRDGAQTTSWLGLVVPKRYAKRAVTRNLIKRQMRATVLAQSQSKENLPSGFWVLRLCASFGQDDYVSAASPALRDNAREELSRVVSSAARRVRNRISLTET